MNYYKFIVAYDGTDYCGWQFQPEKPTIAGELSKTFERVFATKASIVGASRTDSGVHAIGQVALCRTELSISSESLMWAWNNRLPSSISIRSCTQADDTFHPQRCVKQKTYQYHISFSRPLPYLHRYSWFLQAKPDLEKLNSCSSVMCGHA